LHQCLHDHGQLTTITAMSSNQKYAVRKAASATVSLRRTTMDHQIFLRRGTDVGARQFDAQNNAVENFHAALRRRVKVAHPNLYTFLGGSPAARHRGRRDRYRTTEPSNVYPSLKRTHQLDQRNTHASRLAFPASTAARTHACNFCAQ